MERGNKVRENIDIKKAVKIVKLKVITLSNPKKESQGDHSGFPSLLSDIKLSQDYQNHNLSKAYQIRGQKLFMGGQKNTAQEDACPALG